LWFLALQGKSSPLAPPGRPRRPAASHVEKKVLAIKLQKRLSLAIKLSKSLKFGHWAVLMGGFIFFYFQFSPYNLK
jgi:hypothetical protein